MYIEKGVWINWKAIKAIDQQTTKMKKLILNTKNFVIKKS